MEVKTTIDEVAKYAIQATEFIEVDLLIIGGGPAGLSAGIYAQRNGLETVVVEKGKLGGQVLDTTVVENYPGLKQVTGIDLAGTMAAHALDYVNVYDSETVHTVIPSSPFLVITDKRMIHAKSVILATGAKRRPLGLPEEDRYWGKGLSYSPTKDGSQYVGKKALIVGGGDSAVTEAIYLKEIGVDITLVHRSERLDAQKALVDQLYEAEIPVMYGYQVKEMIGNDVMEGVVLVSNQTGKTHTEPSQGLFISIGYIPAYELAEKLGLELTEDRYIEHDSCRTSIPRLYVAGDISGGYKQIVTASSQGAEAALTAYHDLERGKI